jgi:hypothetical protein
LFKCSDDKSPLYELVKRFSGTGLFKDSIQISTEEEVDMFLHAASHDKRFRVIHNTFTRSIKTISPYFKQVVFAVGELRQEMIKTPTSQASSKIKKPYIPSRF